MRARLDCLTVLLMAAKKTRKNSGGRPPKGGGETASLTLTTRWTPTDKALLEVLVSSERRRLEAAGILPVAASRVAAADILRSLVRQEAERRGLVEPCEAQAG